VTSPWLAGAAVGSLVLGSLLAAGQARADAPEPVPTPAQTDVEGARTHYKRGVQLYEQGAYEPALSELQLAERLAPTYKLAYNIALVQVRLGDAASALRSFRRYLDAGGTDIPPARKAEVDGYLTDLGLRVASVDLSVNVAGAAITVDDRPLGNTPLSAPVELNPGPHRITASKAGFASVTREVDAAPGERVTLPLSLSPSEPVPSPPVLPSALPPASVVATPPSAVVPELAPPAPRGSPPPLWVGWTVTGVLASGAVATGIAALVESHVVSQDVNDYATSEGAIHSAHQTTVSLALASDILTASALVSGLVTGYFFFSSKHREPATHATRVELRIAPAITPSMTREAPSAHGGVVELAGTF
jgi:hypothetical protein